MSDVSPVPQADRPKEDVIEISSIELAGPPVTIVNEASNSETKVRAQRFVDLVKDGTSPKDAAKAVGSTIQSFAERGDFAKAVTDLLGKFALDAELQQKMVEAGLNKMFVESVGSRSLDERKHALAVAKQIGQNTGLSPSDGVSIDLGSLTDVIKDASLPGIPEFKEPTNENN